MRPAGCRSADPILEAALLVGRELWDSTRARLFDGDAVSVLMSSRRDSPGTSDVAVTLIARTGAFDADGPVTITLTGEERTHCGRLDARGCCTIRGVPDGRYRVGVARAPAGSATVLYLPVD